MTSPIPAAGAAKPWYASRTIWGVVVTLAAQLLSRWGYQLSPDLQGEVVDLVLQAVSAGGAGLAVWGRVAASKPIARPIARPGGAGIAKALLVAGLLGTLTLGGPSACAALEDTETPAQQAYALRADLVAAQEAAIAYLSSGATDRDVVLAIQAAEATAYAAMREYEAAVLSGDPAWAHTAAAAANAAVAHLVHYLSLRGML